MAIKDVPSYLPSDTMTLEEFWRREKTRKKSKRSAVHVVQHQPKSGRVVEG